MAKLDILRRQILKEKELDIFAPVSVPVSLRAATIGHLDRSGLGSLLPADVLPVGPGTIVAPMLPPSAGSRFGELLQPAISTAPVVSRLPTLNSGVLLGKFKGTAQQGSYNAVVTVSGVSPISKTRFVRKELVSVLVR